MKIGILTGGGDAPGLNGVIESATKFLNKNGADVIGIMDGFEGVFNLNTITLDSYKVDGAYQTAGTILGTSNKRGIGDDAEEFIEKFNQLGLDGLIAAGGDGTFKALGEVASKVNILGIPKTIDNDLAGTDMTFGHYTACSLISKSIATLKHSANAHKRVMILETMGRTAGWLALNGGRAGYSDAILIPEKELNFKELVSYCKSKLSEGKRGLVICTSEGVKYNGKTSVKKIVEGAPEKERLGGISEILAQALEEELSIECRNVILGHLQRSEPPEIFDKLFSMELGSKAAELALSGEWNKGLAYKNCGIKAVNLKEFSAPPRLIEQQNNGVEQAKHLGIFM